MGEQLTLFASDKKSAAWTLIDSHLRSCLPPGAPQVHRMLMRSRFAGSGRKRIATATVEMFDGVQATVEVFQWASGCFGHRWTTMDGGCAYYEDGRWQREPA